MRDRKLSIRRSRYCPRPRQNGQEGVILMLEDAKSRLKSKLHAFETGKSFQRWRAGSISPRVEQATHTRPILYVGKKTIFARCNKKHEGSFML